jgi:hypothetical protein
LVDFVLVEEIEQQVEALWKSQGRKIDLDKLMDEEQLTVFNWVLSQGIQTAMNKPIERVPRIVIFEGIGLMGADEGALRDRGQSGIVSALSAIEAPTFISLLWANFYDHSLHFRREIKVTSKPLEVLKKMGSHLGYEDEVYEIEEVQNLLDSDPLARSTDRATLVAAVEKFLTELQLTGAPAHIMAEIYAQTLRHVVEVIWRKKLTTKTLKVILRDRKIFESVIFRALEDTYQKIHHHTSARIFLNEYNPSRVITVDQSFTK